MEKKSIRNILKVILALVLLYSEQGESITKQNLSFSVTISKGLCDIKLSEKNIDFEDIPINDIEQNNVEVKNFNIFVSNCTSDINSEDAAPKVILSGNTIYNSNSIFNNKRDSSVGFIFKNKDSSSIIEKNSDVWHYDKNSNSLSISLDLSLKCLNDNCQSVKEGKIYSNVKFSFFYF